MKTPPHAALATNPQVRTLLDRFASSASIGCHRLVNRSTSARLPGREPTIAAPTTAVERAGLRPGAPDVPRARPAPHSGSGRASAAQRPRRPSRRLDLRGQSGKRARLSARGYRDSRFIHGSRCADGSIARESALMATVRGAFQVVDRWSPACRGLEAGHVHPLTGRRPQGRTFER